MRVEAVLPQAKKCRPNAVARAAAFRRRREHDCREAGGRATQEQLPREPSLLRLCEKRNVVRINGIDDCDRNYSRIGKEENSNREGEASRLI